MRERCIRQFALTAERTVQFLLSPMEVDPCTAANVMLSTDHNEDTRITESIKLLISHTLFYLEV